MVDARQTQHLRRFRFLDIAYFVHIEPRWSDDATPPLENSFLTLKHKAEVALKLSNFPLCKSSIWRAVVQA